MSAAVYAVGAIRELLPIFKTLGISQMQEQNAAKTLESFLVVDAANRMKYVVPPYKRQTFSQDYLGAFEAACLRNGIYFNTQEWGIVHTMLRKIKPYFDQTDLILPIISLALRATKSFMGIPTWNWQQQALNALRIAGDALAIANWVHKFGRSRIVANSLSTTPTNILGFHNYMSIVGEFVRIGAFTAGFELGANLINYGVPMIARFMENVVEVGVDLADVFYGTANFAEGAIETAKRGDLTHSIPLSSYGLLNAVSGLAFTLDGIDVIHGRWVKPMKSVSIGFQLGATAFCGYFVSYSINHS